MTTLTRPTHARSLQNRLARAEAARRDAWAALHHSCCQKLSLPETATDSQINDEFARRIAAVIHRYECLHGPLPGLPPATLDDDLAALDEATLLARSKATLLRDGYRVPGIAGDAP